MSRILLFASLISCCLSGWAAEDAKRVVGQGGRLFGDPDVDALLARPYAEHVPMACSGERVWAGHPSGWAFADNTHYYLLTPGGVGFDLLVRVGGEVVEPTDGMCYPSHVSMDGASDAVAVHGAKWITADDVMCAQLELVNRTAGPVDVRAELILPCGDLNADEDRLNWQARLHGLNVSFEVTAPGFEPVRAQATYENVFLVEAEEPVSQRGSTGADLKSAASNGQVLGSDFGGAANDQAEWRIAVGEPIKNAVLSVRYARAMEGDAEFKLTLGNGVVRHGFEPTGGWGDAPGHFRVVTFPLGDIPAGPQVVKALVISDGCNVNFDYLAIHPADAPLPTGRAESRLERAIRLDANESEIVTVFLAAGSQPRQVSEALDRMAPDDPLAYHKATCANWLVDNVPVFAADDALTRMYWHRAVSVTRKTLFRVGEGRLTRWGIAEGRWNNTWYPNMISYGAGHQIRECRWLREPMYVRDIISTWCENAKANGVFPSFIRPSEIGDGQYTDWITSAAWDAYCVAPDATLLAGWAEALRRNVDGWLATYDKDGDGLLLVDSHWWTGMEWQPSFFYFNGFDKDKQDQQLERVDLTAYVYGNARALARVLAALGDSPGAARYDAVADKIRRAMEQVMWDEGSKFFYSVEPDTHDKALVKEVIGVYPFYFSMFGAGSAQAEAWTSLLDPEEFWTDWPVASASKKCPAYSQDEDFHGKHVGGCMWNGPTWPHANSIVMSAMAATLRDSGESPLRTDDLHALLRSFTMAQYLNQDPTFPWTGEYYNGDNAQWRTSERDYNHSTYADVIIADIVGLRARTDDVLELRPLLSATMPRFLLDGVRYHGHDVTVAWNAPEAEGDSPDGMKGFRVYVDACLVYHEEAAPSRIELPGYGLAAQP